MTDRAGLDIGLEPDTLSSGAGVLDLSTIPPPRWCLTLHDGGRRKQG